MTIDISRQTATAVILQPGYTVTRQTVCVVMLDQGIKMTRQTVYAVMLDPAAGGGITGGRRRASMM